MTQVAQWSIRHWQSITIHNDTTIYSVHIAPVARLKFFLGIGGKTRTNFVLKIDGDDRHSCAANYNWQSCRNFFIQIQLRDN